MKVWSANKLIKYFLYAILIMLTGLLINIMVSFFDKEIELHKKLTIIIIIPSIILFQIFIYQFTKSMREEE